MTDLIVWFIKQASAIGLINDVSGILTKPYDFIHEMPTAMTILNFMKVIAYGLVLVHFLLQLSDSATSESFTIEHFLKHLAKTIISILIINITGTVFQYLFNFGNNIAGYVGTTVTSKVAIDGNLRKTVDEAGTWERICLLVAAMFPGLLGYIVGLAIKVLASTRIIECTVRFIFAPVAVSNIINGGVNSHGVRYMKKFIVVAAQGAVILAAFYFGSKLIGYSTMSKLSGSGIGETINLIMKSMTKNLVAMICSLVVSLKAQSLLSEAFGC